MKRRVITLCLLIPMLLYLIAPLNGDRISDKIQLNGFLSQGYVYSTKNDFIPQSSKYGSFEWNEFALTISADVSKKLRVGFQLLARDFGTIGNHALKLDWGVADYRFADSFSLRVGKIKSPIGFYNEIRDTDALFPMVALPQSIYDESMRSVFVAYNGVGLYGNLDIGVGKLNYHLFAGGVNHSSDAPYLTQVRNSINRGFAQQYMRISQIEMDTEVFLGGRLIWNTPLQGLRLGGSMVYMENRYKGEVSVPNSPLPIQVFGNMTADKVFVLSAEWAVGDFTISAEYMELPIKLSLELMGNNMQLADETMQGWYVMLSYVFGDKLTLYTYYDKYLADKGDEKGQLSINSGLPAYFGWQKDIVAGFRYDVNFNWTIKTECHFIDGVSKSAVMFPNFENTHQKWFMLAAKISYNF